MIATRKPGLEIEPLPARGDVVSDISEIPCPFSEDPAKTECGPGCFLYQPSSQEERCACKFRKSWEKSRRR